VPLVVSVRYNVFLKMYSLVRIKSRASKVKGNFSRKKIKK